MIIIIIIITFFYLILWLILLKVNQEWNAGNYIEAHMASSWARNLGMAGIFMGTAIFLFSIILGFILMIFVGIPSLSLS